MWPWEETGEQGRTGEEMQRWVVRGLSFLSRTTGRKAGIRGFQEGGFREGDPLELLDTDVLGKGGEVETWVSL